MRRHFLAQQIQPKRVTVVFQPWRRTHTHTSPVNVSVVKHKSAAPPNTHPLLLLLANNRLLYTILKWL
uniref:Caspase inhibitor n=1 Tax=Spilarctia obliqua nucleopolyhedrovirus TaxID=1638618 RepID=A0A7G9U8J9_9ABAC|nr:caspase inhibitor [Spilarctia obliqua nucleopolyhedrovirus]